MIDAKDILGQNARNMLYIHPYNSKRAISLANSKLRTKQFLEVRDIPVPKLYSVISRKNELHSYPWHLLPDSFAMKPNAGLGGEGIIIINDRKQDIYIETSGKEHSEQDLENHVHDILDGRYSIGSVSDKVLFEQLIVNHTQVEKIAYKGLCDIRIIVFNLVPVMAMMRIPTLESGGKANVHLGGIGAGIDLGKGTVTHLTQHNKLIREIPGVGNIRGMKIPFWDEMLLIASRTQQLTGIGYLAVDLALDHVMGPVLLEINARAGLMLQIANLAPLRRRLERVKGIKIKTPAKGVRIAQDLFGGGLEKSISYLSGKEIVGIEETMTLFTKQGPRDLRAKVQIDSPRTYVRKDIFEDLRATLGERDTGKEFIKVKTQIRSKKLTSLLYAQESMEDGIDCILGQRDLKSFLIDPNNQQVVQKPKEAAKVSHVLDRPLARVDEELQHLAEYVKVLRYLKPINMYEEREKFLKKAGNYNPTFVYRSLDFDAKELTSELEQLHFDDSKLGHLLHEKRKRLLDEVELITTIGRDHRRFLDLSDRLYGRVEQSVLTLAKERLVHRVSGTSTKTIGHEEAAKLVRARLDSYELHDWNVEISPTVVSAMAVSGKGIVRVREGELFDARGLEATLRHEIETHVFRGLNGAEHEYEIFRTGTAQYLETEEGLAIYLQEQVLNQQDEKYFRAAKNYVQIAKVQHLSFRDGVKLLMTEGFAHSLEHGFQIMFRLKRGMSDTKKPGVLTRDLIYFRGYLKIREYFARGGTLEDLFLGKIALRDVSAVKEICEPLPDPYLPFPNTQE